MYVELYIFNKRSNSTKRPDNSGVKVNVMLKDGTSIYTPIFVLTDYETKYNYIKWDNRYYYINDVEITRTNVFTLTCNIDFLATYRDDVFNTNALVKYSTSRYNINIPDNRLRTDTTATQAVSSAVLITDGVEHNNQFQGGTYIVNYVTTQSTFGPSGVLWLTTSQCMSLAAALTDPTFFAIDNFEKQFQNVYQSIISVRYVPFRWVSGTQTPIYLGSWRSGINGRTITQTMRYTTTIRIPYLFGDWRDSKTSYLMYLSGYGFTTLNADDLKGKTSLTVKLDIDGVTGQGTYIVENLFKGSCNFGTSVSIGTVSGNAAGFINSALQAGASHAAGNSLGVLSGATNAAITAISRNVGNVGSQGGLSAAFATSGAAWQNVYLYAIGHNTTVPPASIADTRGRPLNAVRRLSTLGGYVETDNASVTSVNDYVNSQLNAYLDGGVYIE